MNESRNELSILGKLNIVVVEGYKPNSAESYSPTYSNMYEWYPSSSLRFPRNE